jgi:hypothetical protein
MFGDDAPLLPDDDAVGIGVEIDGSADGAGVDRIFVACLSG